MGVDVSVETTIDRPVADVASYAADPANAPHWYAHIETIAWRTGSPVALGSMRLRHDGEPVGFSRAVAPVLGPAMRRAMTRGLVAPERILEA